MLISAPAFRRLIALLCVAAALNFGLASLQGRVAELHHYVHGDEAVADGGWVIADAHHAHDGEVSHDHHGAPDQPQIGDVGQNDADGHHHHVGGDHAGAGLPAVLAAASVHSAPDRLTPLAAPRLNDADPGASGPVPRAMIRTV